MDINELEGNSLIVIRIEDLQSFANYLAKKFITEPKSENSKLPEVEQPISQSEAIVFLGKSRQTFSSWRRKGIIKAHVIGGRIYYFKSELLAAMK